MCNIKRGGAIIVAYVKVMSCIVGKGVQPVTTRNMKQDLFLLWLTKSERTWLLAWDIWDAQRAAKGRVTTWRIPNTKVDRKLLKKHFKDFWRRRSASFQLWFTRIDDSDQKFFDRTFTLALFLIVRSWYSHNWTIGIGNFKWQNHH